MIQFRSFFTQFMAARTTWHAEGIAQARSFTPARKHSAFPEGGTANF